MDNFISVIIPTYKGNDSLHVALNSLVKQTYQNFEVIVSDDNGKGTSYQELTESVVNKYNNLLKIAYLPNEHVNGSHARNEGIKVAKGDIHVFLDDDDFYFPEYLENVNKAAKEYPNKDIFFFDVAIITKEGSVREVRNSDINYLELLFLKKEIGTGSNLCLRKKVLSDKVFFDERYSRFQDLEFIIKKMAKYEPIWLNKELIVKYYNQTDNYLNYKKYIKMLNLFVSDLHANNLINDSQLVEAKSIMLHSLFNDMLVKNASKDDIREIYQLLKEYRNCTFKDKILYKSYIISTRFFNFAIKIYFNGRINKIDNTKLKAINEYRTLLNKEIL